MPGHGHRTATSIMQAVNRDAADDAFRLIDESHAQLVEDRRTLRAVEAALHDIGPLESMLRDWHARLSARSRAMTS